MHGGVRYDARFIAKLIALEHVCRYHSIKEVRIGSRSTRTTLDNASGASADEDGSNVWDE